MVYERVHANCNTGGSCDTNNLTRPIRSGPPGKIRCTSITTTLPTQRLLEQHCVLSSLARICIRIFHLPIILLRVLALTVCDDFLLHGSGAKTGRSPKDKRIVKDETAEDVWWGKGSPNVPIAEENFIRNRERALDYLHMLDEARAPIGRTQTRNTTQPAELI